MAGVTLHANKSVERKAIIAIATTWHSTELGYRTAIPSADVAHSLAHSLNTSLGNELQPVAQTLRRKEGDDPKSMLNKNEEA